MASVARTRGNVGSQLREYRIDTAWGEMVLTVRGPLVTAVRPPGPPSGLTATERCAPFIDDAPAGDVHPSVRELASRLVAYFDGEPVDLVDDEEQLEAWLDAAGVTGFRRDASLALARVPRGVTLAYGELAALAGRPGAARAAGSACARNPLPVLVPCHRVLHAGARRGDVGTYGAANGPAYKRRLLELEQSLHVRPQARD